MANSRIILAPEIFALTQQQAGYYYLSWQGWEKFMKHNWPELKNNGTPILLDQLLELDTNFFSLLNDILSKPKESLIDLFLNPIKLEKFSLISEIKGQKTKSIHWDYIIVALWSITSYENLKTQELLKKAKEKQNSILAALNGEEPKNVTETNVPASEISNNIKFKVWSSWLNIAKKALQQEDSIIINDLDFLEFIKLSDNHTSSIIKFKDLTTIKK